MATLPGHDDRQPDDVPPVAPSGDPSDAPIDEALAESFPASDPPAWTSGQDPHRIDPPSARGPALVKIYGRLGNASAYAIRDFLHRCDVPFEWVSLGIDRDAREKADVDHLRDERLPVCVFPDGTRMETPTIFQIIERLGWFRNPSRAEYDLAIYGAGPAGLSAAVYAGADGLSTVVVERWSVGGQVGSSSKIANYTEVIALHGDKTLRGITLRHRATGKERSVPTRWLFVCIGGEPQTQWAAAIGMVRDEAGYIVTGPDLMRNGTRPAVLEAGP